MNGSEMVAIRGTSTGLFGDLLNSKLLITCSTFLLVVFMALGEVQDCVQNWKHCMVTGLQLWFWFRKAEAHRCGVYDPVKVTSRLPFGSNSKRVDLCQLISALFVFLERI
jgi:hypothetical protein